MTSKLLAITIAAAALIQGCASFTGCKEISLANAEKYASRGEQVRVMIYDTYNPWPGYTGHAQAQLYRDGRWIYIETTLWITYESDRQSEWGKGRQTCFTLPEYQETLKRGWYDDSRQNCGGKP